METVITTIFFDGQYWRAIIERISETGIESAVHIFGREPSNGELLDFYINRYEGLRFFRGAHNYRLKINYSHKEQARMSRSSRDLYRDALAGELAGRKSEKVQERRKDAKERYEQKQLKKKRKRRGR